MVHSYVNIVDREEQEDEGEEEEEDDEEDDEAEEVKDHTHNPHNCNMLPVVFLFQLSPTCLRCYGQRRL